MRNIELAIVMILMVLSGFFTNLLVSKPDVIWVTHVFTENMQDCIDKDGEYSLRIENGEVRWENCGWADEIDYRI